MHPLLDADYKGEAMTSRIAVTFWGTVIVMLLGAPAKAGLWDDMTRTIDDIRKSVEDAVQTKEEVEREIEGAKESQRPRHQQADPSAAVAGDENAPRYDPLWVREIQQRLGALGYDPGPVDGAFGAKTRKVIQAFERSRHMTVTGLPTPGVMDMLRQQSQALQIDSLPGIAGTAGQPSDGYPGGMSPVRQTGSGAAAQPSGCRVDPCRWPDRRRFHNDGAHRSPLVRCAGLHRRLAAAGGYRARHAPWRCRRRARGTGLPNPSGHPRSQHHCRWSGWAGSDEFAKARAEARFAEEGAAKVIEFARQMALPQEILVRRSVHLKPYDFDREAFTIDLPADGEGSQVGRPNDDGADMLLWGYTSTVTGSLLVQWTGDVFSPAVWSIPPDKAQRAVVDMRPGSNGMRAAWYVSVV